MRAFALALPVIGGLMLIGGQAQAVEEHHRAAPTPGATQATPSAPGPGMMGGMMGNDRLQVGAVETHGDHIAAEIQTVDGSLVQRLIVDPRTGHMSHAQ